MIRSVRFCRRCVVYGRPVSVPSLSRVGRVVTVGLKSTQVSTLSFDLKKRKSSINPHASVEPVPEPPERAVRFG